MKACYYQKMDLILKVAKFAREAHGTQLRKYTNNPYIYHPARVASRMMLLDNSNIEMACAAFLHDVLEDTKVTKQQLIDNFGNEIADLVDELTNKFTKEQYPKLNRKERKEKELERIASISTNAKLIKMLDRIDNLKEIDLTDGFAVTYLDESHQLYFKLKNADVQIAEELHQIILGGKWTIHMKECDNCRFFPVSPSCDIGTKLLALIDSQGLIAFKRID